MSCSKLVMGDLSYNDEFSLNFQHSKFNMGFYINPALSHYTEVLYH